MLEKGYTSYPRLNMENTDSEQVTRVKVEKD